MNLRLIAETDNIQPGDVLCYRRQYYELTVKCTVERVTKAYIFVKNEGGYEVKFKRRNAEDMAGTHYLYIDEPEEQKNAAPAEPATEDLHMTEAILCVYGVLDLNHNVISKEAALSVAEQAKAQGKIKDYRVEGGDKDGKIVAIIAEPDLEDFPAEGITIARYNDPKWLAAHLPEGLEKLEAPRRCSIAAYGGDEPYECNNLAFFSSSGNPICEEHMKAASEMNSDNEEHFKTALEWHKSDVGKAEELAAYKTALAGFTVYLEPSSDLPEPYTHTYHMSYNKSGSAASGGMAESELDAFRRMYCSAMIRGYVAYEKKAQAEPEKTATINPEAVESFEDPTKPYINTDVLPTQVYIPADDSHEARTVETEPVINFEYYPSFLIMRCPRCDKNYKTHLRPDWPALEVLATLLHSMDACPDCGRPGPEGLKRALLSAMHAEADRIENPPELAEDEGSNSEMGYDPYSGGYSSDL